MVYARVSRCLILLLVSTFFDGCGMVSQRPHFRLVEGVEVTSLEGIQEGYSKERKDEGYYVFRVNVSAEHITDYYLALSALVSAPAFFLVELPVDESEEIQLRPKKTDPFHRAVYYLDGIDYAKGKELFGSYERLLVHDGMANFGYGSHSGHDEVYVGPYKIFSIYADEPEKYQLTLAKLGIPEVPDLRTVWDNFTEDSPGKRNPLAEAKTIWDMLAELKSQGLYRAETRDD